MPKKANPEEEPEVDDGEDEKVPEKVSDEAATNAIKQLVAKYADLSGDFLSYVGSTCAALANEDDEVSEEGWVSALSAVLSDVMPDQATLKDVCKQAKAMLTPAEQLGKNDPNKDPSVLAHVEPLTLGFMGKILFLRSKLHLERGHRYGIVGENGAGKSTLMRKIANKEIPGFPQDIKINYVQADFDEQDDAMTPGEFLTQTQIAEGHDRDPEAIEKVLDQLSFTDKLRATSLGDLSGGWRMRVSLARATMIKSDLLLLDEPTNHLDSNAVEWLMGFLQSVNITVIVISHEPFFLDAVVTDIIWLKNKKIRNYEGNFSAFTKKQRDFTAEDLEGSAAPSTESALNFRFPDPGKPIGVASLTKSVLTMKNVFFRYNENTDMVLKDITCRLTLSSRVAVVGPNGAGKSTLVKLMVGDNPASQGSIWKHHNLLVAYVAQHTFSHLDTIKTKPVLQYIKQRFGRGYDNEASAFHKSHDKETFTTTYDVREGQVECIMGRRKYKNAMAYEVKWVGKDESLNTWEDANTLRKLGAAKLVEQCDEKLKAKKAGLDTRPLTNQEVTRHLMDFGLDKQYAFATIERLSGGQKCKLVLAAAMWLKPHLLVLDEPTNYLDLEALGALARAINKFKGGMIMVSHNKEFISEICNEKWTVDEGKLVITQGVDKPEVPQAKVIERTNMSPRRKREVQRRHSSMRMSTKSEAEAVLDMFGEDGLQSADAGQRKEAAQVILEDIQNNSLDTSDDKTDAVIQTLQGCVDHGLNNKNVEIWEAVLKIVETVIAKYGQELTGPISSFIEQQLAQVGKSDSNASTAQVGGPTFKVGDDVQALFTDKKFYPAKITKITSTDPVKYTVEYAAPLSKTATVPEKGGVKAAVNLTVAASDSNETGYDVTRVRAGLLVAKGYLGVFQSDKAAVVDALIKALTEEGVFPSETYADKATGDTPSSIKATMQIAKCLTTLLPAVESTEEIILDTLLDKAVNAPSLPLRRGAACAAASIIHTRTRLIKFGVYDKIIALIKGDKAAKEASLVLYERLFAGMGAAFEYTIGNFLPHLLAAFGERDSSVVDAAKNTCMAIMSNLSPHGAKLMLPGLLAGLNQKSWKLKVDCVRVLGSMAFCTPALMASSLPVIVPQLLEVMAEPKREVSESAQEALTEIAGVISNPEIKPLVPLLHKALKDSFNHTKTALENLAKTSFAHAIDPASLALIMPIVIKGIKDRKPETKKLALQVVSALAALILDIHDIIPYLPKLMKNLKVMIFHNLPDIRVEAGKALGAMVNEVGHEDRYFPGFSAWLDGMMTSKDTTPTQMSGAGTALSYILFGQSIEAVQPRLPQLLKLTLHQLQNVRVGHLDLLVVMSDVFGDAFGDMYLDQILPVILKGLEDPVLPVQESAFEACQEYISRNARDHLQYILPLLEEGLKNKDYKIRTFYLQLIGTTLLNLVTTTNFGMSVRFYGDGNTIREGELANQANKEQEGMIEAAMGTETRDRLFSAIYRIRSDVVDTVGSMAWRVWHLVVPNEKSLLMDIHKEFFKVMLDSLASDNNDDKEAARKAMGNFVTVCDVDGLHVGIPILKEHLTSEDPGTRSAACLGYGEVLRSADKGMIGSYLNDIIPSIRDMLTDSQETVRKGAGSAFRQLYKNVGTKAIEKIAPYLIDSMKSDSADLSVVDGLAMVLEACARNTFFYLTNTIISTLKPFDNDVNEALRSHLVKQLTPMTTDVADVVSINSLKALQRYAEELPKSASSRIRDFVGPILKRLSPYLREPVKQAIYQCLYHAFGYHLDQAKAREGLVAVINDPPPGFIIANQAGMLTEDETNELLEVLSNLTPESAVTDLANMKLPEDAPEPEAAAADAAADAAGAAGVKVGANEKLCSKCNKVKPKSKFSKKMVTKPNGVCKVCA